MAKVRFFLPCIVRNPVLFHPRSWPSPANTASCCALVTCGPRWQKGKIEPSVGYLRQTFWPRFDEMVVKAKAEWRPALILSRDAWTLWLCLDELSRASR